MCAGSHREGIRVSVQVCLKKNPLCFLLLWKVITHCKFFASCASNYLDFLFASNSYRKIARIQIDFFGFSVYYFLNTTSSSYFSIISYFTAVHTWAILSEERVVGFEALQCSPKSIYCINTKYLYFSASGCWILD